MYIVGFVAILPLIYFYLTQPPKMQLDINPKVVREFRSKTLGLSVYISYGVIVVSVGLLFLQIVTFIRTPPHKVSLGMSLYVGSCTNFNVVVNDSSGHNMTIAFDVSFPHIGCKLEVIIK